MIQRIIAAHQATLAILDEGLRLYRRNFIAFVLIAASWFVPVAIATGILIAIGDQLDEITVMLVMLGAMVLLFPLLIYLIGGLSRAARLAADERPVRFREVM